MKILQNNPYRLLGVFANSPSEERLTNRNLISASLKIGKDIKFPLDLSQYLSKIIRDKANIAAAKAKLNSPKQLISYAQFWFLKVSPLDEIAYNYLLSKGKGGILKAQGIWKERESMSALQNLIVCSLVRNDFADAIYYAEKLYKNPTYVKQFVLTIAGDADCVKAEELVSTFIESLANEIGVSRLSNFIDSDWKAYLPDKMVGSLLETIENAIVVAKETRKERLIDGLQAGIVLYNSSKNAISQLKKILPESDSRYRNIADKLGLELMQCALDYYHKSEDLDVAFKSISFMRYAKRVAVSQAVKDKCKGTCDAFQRCAEEGLPTEVLEENKAIYSSLKLFEKRSKSIKNSIRLIKECEPHIVSIKEKIGNGHPYYFKISTIIVSNALTNVIFEVEISKKKNLEVMKSTLIEAWRTLLYLDKFDLEPTFKEGTYKRNRDSLVDLIDSEGGFDTPSRRLPYQRGWCSNIDVNDVDLRTDEELYQACDSLASLTNYVNKFPQGKHIEEVKNRIVVLSFKECKTIHDLQNFLEKFPESSFVPKAREALESLLEEEKKKRQVRSKQEKAISMCQSIDDVIELYLKEKNNDISVERCSLKACECSKSTEDYKEVISIFGANSMGGREAEKKVEEIVSQEKENRKKRNKRIKRYSLLVTPLLILLFVYIFWGVAGLATVCTIFAWLFAIIALFCLCTGNVLIAVLAGLCFWGIFKLGNYLKDLSYYQMITPTESYQSPILDTETNANSFSNTDSEDSEKSQEEIDYEKYIDNQLKTGDKPYRDYYESHIGDNYLEFKKADSDYVILARRSKTGKVVNHMYIRKNDTARMYLPDGTYYVYFYSGKGWNPYKDVGNVRGGFVSNEQIQKDGPLSLHEQHVVYTLYMEEGGNLEMQGTTVDEAL